MTANFYKIGRVRVIIKARIKETNIWKGFVPYFKIYVPIF